MYIQYNPNPINGNAKDCVIRALTIAVGKNWFRVYDELSELGRSRGTWGCYSTVWEPYLRKHNFKKRSIPDYCPDCYTFKDFAKDHPRGVYVIASESHVAVIEDGNLYDSWDSSDEIPEFYYFEEV